ncbi:MAG: hypothetical protein KF819_31145 [Labilithrix sp.]|nr:hypothetical protein [Labilithrix sp.]
MRAEIATIIDGLLAASEASREVSLDAIGDAIGARAITPDEIDAIITALESAGRHVATPAGGDGEKHLHAVLAAIRDLAPSLGRRPSIAEIAARSGLAEGDVRHALSLAKIMQR